MINLRRVTVVLPWMIGCFAQSPQKLSLREAEAIAIKNHPRIRSAHFTAMAARQVVTEVGSALYPSFFGSITGAGAADNSRIAAGSLNNPVIFNRFATGFTINQMVTDFGRTGNLRDSSKLRAQAQEETAQATRAQVLLQVDRAYYAVLRAQTVLRVAEQTVAARQLIVDQVTALANSKLKSGLDVSFANVNLSEAKLLLLGAQNEVNAAVADLSLALGYPERQDLALSEEPMPLPMPAGVSQLINDALRARPEVASLQFEYNAALKFARVERALYFPTISALASSGIIPGHEDSLRARYGAAGINVSLPIFNGHLFSARRAEAELRSRAVEQDIRDLENRISRDVRLAWLNANTAFQRLSLTAQLLDQATQALDLAQTRYDLGLSSIVELSQAQLNKTSAEIANAGAVYDYQLRRAVLDYETGQLK